MNSNEFCFWLNGFFELSEGDVSLTPRQVQIMKDHLALVFTKITPDRSTPAKPDVPTPYVPIQPFWEVDKKTYNPQWPLYPTITCNDKACLDVPTPAGPISNTTLC